MIGQRFLRYLLAALHAVVCINAFAGGYYGISGARGVPPEWLEGSSFTSYFIPSLILMIVVGGASLIATVLLFLNSRRSISASFIAGAILLVWIVVQLLIIGYVSWMQPAILITALLILLLTYYAFKKQKINLLL